MRRTPRRMAVTTAINFRFRFPGDLGRRVVDGISGSVMWPVDAWFVGTWCCRRGRGFNRVLGRRFTGSTPSLPARSRLRRLDALLPGHSQLSSVNCRRRRGRHCRRKRLCLLYRPIDAIVWLSRLLRAAVRQELFLGGNRCSPADAGARPCRLARRDWIHLDVGDPVQFGVVVEFAAGRFVEGRVKSADSSRSFSTSSSPRLAVGRAVEVFEGRQPHEAQLTCSLGSLTPRLGVRAVQFVVGERHTRLSAPLYAAPILVVVFVVRSLPPTAQRLHGKYSERVQLPAKAKFGVFVANTWQHLLHLLLEV